MSAWDPKGNPVDTYYGTQTWPNGTLVSWAPGLYPSQNVAILGKYTVRLSCITHTPGKPNVVAYRKDAYFTITLPYQQLTLSATTIHRGQSVTIHPVQGCPTDATSASGELRYGDGETSPNIGGSSDMSFSSPAWSYATYDFPNDAPTGNYVVELQCLGPIPGVPVTEGQRPLLDYKQYTITVVP